MRYNWLQKITKSRIYFFMPLNINIIFLGCLFDQMFISLMIWCFYFNFIIFFSVDQLLFQRIFHLNKISKR